LGYLKKFILGFACLALPFLKGFAQANVTQNTEGHAVSFASGNTFYQAKAESNPPPLPLQTNEPVPGVYPYALVASKDSFLEIKQAPNQDIIRLGRSSAIEFRSADTVFLFQGSVLFCNRHPQTWKISSDKSQFQMQGSGTWMIEVTSLGFKVIILEGKLKVNGYKGIQVAKPGKLLLVTDKEGKISQELEVELPLLLGTSRLVNRFPSKLPSHSRLISAAQVQAIRMKKKYEAMVGDVSDDRKLQIWEIKKEKEK
jgi:hypothetical protein